MVAAAAVACVLPAQLKYTAVLNKFTLQTHTHASPQPQSIPSSFAPAEQRGALRHRNWQLHQTTTSVAIQNLSALYSDNDFNLE